MGQFLIVGSEYIEDNSGKVQFLSFTNVLLILINENPKNTPDN